LQFFGHATLLKACPAGFQYILTDSANVVADARWLRFVDVDADVDATLQTRTQNSRIRTSLVDKF